MAGYEERLVSFVDMLGFTEFIKRSSADPALVGWLHEVVEAAKTNSAAQFAGTGSAEGGLQITTFSDSIIISDIADEAGFAPFMFATMEVVVRLQYHGILARGGIGTGKLFHSDNTLFGPAFIEAYELERSVASLPQIVFSTRSIRFLDALCRDHPGWRDWLGRMTVMERSPRVIRLEPFHVFYDDRLREMMKLPFTVEEFCVRARESTLRHLRDNMDRPRNFEKYEWYAHKLNRLIAAKAPAVGTIELGAIFQHFRPGAADGG